MNWLSLACLGLIACVPQFSYAANLFGPEKQVPSSIELTNPNSAFQITPYIWATGLKGEISPFGLGPTVRVDRSFSEGRDGLNVAGFVNVWGRYDRFVLSANIMYSDTSSSDVFRFPGTSTLPAVDVMGAVDTKQFMGALQGGYRIVDTPSFTFDALGGIRVWHISNKITAKAVGRSESYSESFGWVDPIVGTRVFANLTEKLSVQAQADIGGFGAGSDLTWSVLSTFNYTLNHNFSISAGYQLLDVDYKHDGHVYDTRFQGPVLGLTYRF